jgi:hypothetical protein
MAKVDFREALTTGSLLVRCSLKEQALKGQESEGLQKL